MKPSKVGQVVKFHSPMPDENPNQLFVILEILKSEFFESALIKPLKTGLKFPPLNTVNLEDLTITELPTDELIGYNVRILKPDGSYVNGRVESIKESKINLNLDKKTDGVLTNVTLIIVDKYGNKHEGLLIIN